MSCFDALLGGLPMSTAALLLVLFSSSVELIGAKSVQPVNATIARLTINRWRMQDLSRARTQKGFGGL